MTMQRLMNSHLMPTIRFTSIGDLKSAQSATLADAICVTDVPSEVVEALLEAYEEHKIRISSYNEESMCLIMTITHAPHEQLHIQLKNELCYYIRAMGLNNDWLDRGSQYYHYAQPLSSGGGRGWVGGKMPDSSRSPKDKHIWHSFPTIVFEAGYSQSLQEMQQKARDWFRDSNHDVKIVILAKLDVDGRKITIQRWEERQQGEGRPGAATRWASTGIPDCQQQIEIVRNGTNPSIYEVSGDDLVLSFQQLFLRDLRQGEGDVIIPFSWMQEYAENVWQAWEALY
ncbi:hypothetical protein V8C35DRAFT_288783 [Trichoderma chlorosporum]